MKNLTAFLFLSALLSAFPVSAQLHLDWAKRMTSNGSDLTGTLQMDDKDNLYVGSVFRGDSVDFDPGPGTDWAQIPDHNLMALSKFNADGQYLWSGLFWDHHDLYGSLFEIKNNRLLFIVQFTDSLIYELHGTRLIEAAMPGENSGILELSLEGEVLSAHYFPTPNNCYFNNAITLPDGRILLCGSFLQTFSIGGPDFEVNSNGDYDVFIAMLDASMQPLWIKSYGSAGEDYIANIDFNASGKVYFAFNHTQPITINTTSGPVSFTAAGDDNIVFGYGDQEGNVEKIYGRGSDGDDEAYTIVADNDGNMYICGYFEKTMNFAAANQSPVTHTPAADSDGFVARYDPEGQLKWVGIYRTSDYGGAYTLTLKRGTDLYVSGGVTLRSDIDPGPDSLIVDAEGHTDAFLSKLTLDGDLVYSYLLGGLDVIGIREVLVSTIHSRVFIHGFYYNNMNCGIGQDTFILQAEHGAEVFLCGYSEDNVVTGLTPALPGEIHLFPNPARDQLHIYLDAPSTQLTVSALDGRVVYFSEHMPEGNVEIDCARWMPGLYVVSYLIDSERHTALFHKE